MNQPKPGSRSCPICRQPLGEQPTAKAKSGKIFHASCLKQARARNGKRAGKRQWDIAAAEREFARHKAAVESGRTFRSRKSSGWKLGSSPSSAGEIRR